MKWYIKLKGDKAILYTLYQVYNTDDFLIEKVADEFLLKSKQFEHCKTFSEVNKIASELIETLNGKIFFLYDIPGSIQIGPVNKINENGERETFVMMGTGSMKLQGYDLTIKIKKDAGESVVIIPKQKTLDILLKVQSSPKARKIFRLMKNGNFEFSDIYKIIEIILSEKGSKIYRWVPKNKIELFKRTANHDHAIGDKARHGVNHTEAPKKPMDLKEARKITKILIEEYINELSTE